MKKCFGRSVLRLDLTVLMMVLGIATVHAATLSWAEQQAQNQELERQALQRRAQQAPSPQVLQYERWKREWVQQHPGEPIPNLGVLEHLHESEIIANTNEAMARMWQARQAQLQWEYQRARLNQQRALVAQHIVWTAEQWKAWDREYDLQARQRAQDYLEAVRQAAEIEEQQRRWAIGIY